MIIFWHWIDNFTHSCLLWTRHPELHLGQATSLQQGHVETQTTIQSHAYNYRQLRVAHNRPKRGRNHATSTQKKPQALESNQQPTWLWFFCANNWTVLFNISAAGSYRGLQTAAKPDGSNGSWRPPPHKRPPLNWWIVFQVIPHYHSDSFCWSRSRRIRHGGLGVTQNAELLFQALWCLLDPPSEIGCTEKRKSPKQTQKTSAFYFFQMLSHQQPGLTPRYTALLKHFHISRREKQLWRSKRKVSLMSRINTVCCKLESSCGGILISYRCTSSLHWLLIIPWC